MGAHKQWYRRDLRDNKMADVPAMEKEDMKKIEKILGYNFEDRSLIEEALTHPSFYYPFKPEITYERLEFMGDAVLNCLVGRWVINMYPELAPGPLTRLRAANVDTEKLARVAVCSGLYRYLRHQAPQLDEQIQDFMEGMKVYPNHSNGLLDPPKVLADIVESILGAIFMDSKSSLETVWKAFKRLAEPLINLEVLGKHPVAELHELCQKRKLDLKFVKDGWTKNMIVKVLINGNMVGSATYGNKKEIAMNRAAKVVLDRIEEETLDLLSLTCEQRTPSIGRNRLFNLPALWSWRTSRSLVVGSLLAAVMLSLMLMFSNH
ncbi:ribonuclease 3-like protein 3 [Asparagus officinalis]|nr:ribonuclease 3-like protein 3 [Asparagus officinalis]